MCQQPTLQENGDTTRQESFNRNYMEPASTRSAGSADHPQHNHYHVETLSISTPDDPSTRYDYDHRTTMTIQHQQRQCPQDIWVHSPWQRVLYQPALRYSLQPEPQLDSPLQQQQVSSGDATLPAREARAEGVKTAETNGQASDKNPSE
ncbi:hypothetical protein FSARC_12577 [Fusarium sarcochroum]|uniref:Uncharacterized protein n=1 Tax=Fusarium sarcochroum TaxID=1208366 RepID=A0A8H4WWA7_9HYPO|nr:hypothetical protein FSARC_12577 [Fusarium sarcochroum]